MLMTNNNKTVTFENREEFNRYFNMQDLTLFGYPALFNFETNDSLTFTLIHGVVAVQEGLTYEN